MIELICFVRRKSGMNPTAFHQHWLECHGPLIRDTPELARHIVRYEQNHRLALDYEREDGKGFDGATVQWFRSMTDFVDFCREDAYRELVAPDEASFLDRSAFGLIFAGEPEVMIPSPADPDAAGVKLLCLLRRIESRSSESFQRHWRLHHGPIMRDTPALARHLLGYLQHHRLSSDYARDSGAGYDGMTELWLPDMSAFEALVNESAYAENVVPDEDVLLDRTDTQYLLSGPADVIIG